MNEQINKLLIRDFFASLLNMSDDNVTIDLLTIKKHIEQNDIVEYLLENHYEYFKNTLLVNPEKSANKHLNSILKEQKINYIGQIKYELNDWNIKNNGINYLIGVVFDIQSLLLN